MVSATVNDIELNYQFDGAADAAETVVFSNSLASNLSMWDPQVEVLTSAGYRTLRYDTRGHGQSSSPPGPYRIEDLVDDVVALLDHCELNAVHFCGLSMGGMVAQRLATLHPARIKSLSCCATAAYMNPPGVWDDRIATVDAGGMEAVVEGTLERWFTPQASSAIPEAIDAVRRGILGTSTNGFMSCCAAIRDMDQRDSITAITAPAMVLVGEEDPGTTVDHAREIHSGITGSELVVIPAARHFVNVEKADEFNAALLGFLGAR